MRNTTLFSYVTLIIVESIWWFSGLAIIGAMTGLGGSPIPWLALFLLFAIGVLVAWLLGGAKGDLASLAYYQAIVALLAVYFTVASVTSGDSWSFKIAWPVDMFGGTYSGEEIADLVLGLIASGFIWYRTQALVSGGDVAGRLSRAFKLGTAFMAVALLVELSTHLDLGIAELLLPFFGASLVGMATSRLPQTADAGTASWPVVIGISVLGILGIGVVGGLLTGRYGSYGVRGLLNLWSALVDLLLWILYWPIQLIMRAIVGILNWIRERFGEIEEEEDVTPPLESGEEILNATTEQAEKATEFALDALRWPLSILLVVVLFFVLVFAYRRFSSRFGGDGDDERESIRGDADAKADMMKLLTSLVPNWMKRGKQRSLWKWPEGEQGIAEVFLLYFDTLAHAIKRGMIFDPKVTPNERTAALEVFLPGAPVGAVTSRFNAACYGGQPSDPAEIERLRQGIETAAEKPRPDEEN